jgi:DNA ligase D-like protein (predicted polymerase)
VAKEEASEVLSIEGRAVGVTHPDKLYFSAQAISKLDLVRYYLSIAPGALAGIRDRPLVLKRFVNGADAPAFYQKRAPGQRPPWLRTVTLSFPSGRTAEEIVVNDAAGLAWIVNLGCIELHPHPVRSGDLEHPDELRIDLDPVPGVSWADVCRVALEVQALLEELGLRGWPKTSGSRVGHSQKYVARQSRCHVQSSVARPLWPPRNGGRKSVMVSSSTTTRTRKTGPPALRIRCVRFRTLASRRRFIGMRSLTVIQPSSPYSQFRIASRKSAILTRAWTLRPARWKSCLSSRQRTKLLVSATPPGRHTFGRWTARHREWRPHAPNQRPLSRPSNSRG